METINYNEVKKKILKFLNNNSSKHITNELIRDSFSIEERIMMAKDYKCPLKKYELFTKEEAEKIITDQNKSTVYYIFKLVDDELLIKTYENKIKKIQNSEDVNTLTEIIYALKSDDSRKKTLEILQRQSTSKLEEIELDLKENLDYTIISTFEDDKLKMENLNKLNKEDRGRIISSFKEDKNKEKYINFFSGNNWNIISSLSTDEKKKNYLNKYNLFLASDEKIDIITSFKNTNNILEYTNKLKDSDKLEVLSILINESNITLTDDIYNKIIEKIESEEVLCEILSINYVNDKQHLNSEIFKKIKKISNQLEAINYLPDNEKLQYLTSFNEPQKIEIIKRIPKNSNIFVKALKTLNEFSSYENIIEHLEYFMDYNDNYEEIIEKYANNYNLNKEHLIALIKKYNLSILKLIKNKNIQNIVNLDEENFQKLNSLFSEENMTLDNQSLNNTLNSILQRRFKMNESETIFIFNNILTLLQNNDIDEVIETLKEIENLINIEKYLNKSNITKENFIKQLTEQNQNAIRCLNEITTAYIIQNRNKYTKDNLEYAIKNSTKERLEIKSFVKAIISNYSEENIIQNLEKIKIKLTEDETKILENKDLIKEIISYKKNNQTYIEIPENIKKELRTFEQMIKKLINHQGKLTYFEVVKEKIKKEYYVPSIDNNYIIEVLTKLDAEKLKTGILNNPEIFEKLNQTLKKYKILGWEKLLDKNLNEVEILTDTETIANFIQYFQSIYEVQKEKVDKKEIAAISLTALLDIANSYSTESKKYSILFGTEDFKLISSNPGPNSAVTSKEERIKKSIDLLTTVRKRNYVTVPPIDNNYELTSNKKINIVVGNFSNPMNLTYGERTGSCMRSGGAGESLFKFCLKNENGFHIRFINPSNGKFVSRVSGFRNGNTVFLNQLRFPVDPNYTDEDIKEACKIISNELIELSKNSKTPIENVVISPDYVMINEKTTYLNVTNIKRGIGIFYSDVDEKAVVLATTEQNKAFAPVKLGNLLLEKYPVQRDKKQIYYDEQCNLAMQHIHMMDQVLLGKNIEQISIKTYNNNNICYTGEDWYVAIDKDGNINKFIMESSKNKQLAIKEIEQLLEKIKYTLSTEITDSKKVGR